jgi:hypothetical protein
MKNINRSNFVFNPNQNGLFQKEPCYVWMMIAQKVLKCQKFKKIAMPTSRS